MHVWKCLFVTRGNTQERFNCLLSKEESVRADNFVRIQDRERFICFHGALRIVLGVYTNTPPQLIDFKKDRYGKPELSGDAAHSEVRFSLSHSQDVALIAVTRDRKIGIDVEYLRPMGDAKDIVQNYFSHDEQRVLFSLSEDEFQQSFFICWTLKEAYTKAIGKGLSLPLAQFTVPFERWGACSNEIHSKGLFREMGAWRFMSLFPHIGYVGALVAEELSILTCYSYNF